MTKEEQAMAIKKPNEMNFSNKNIIRTNMAHTDINSFYTYNIYRSRNTIKYIVYSKFITLGRNSTSIS